jgi:hypothetical protein
MGLQLKVCDLRAAREARSSGMSLLALPVWLAFLIGVPLIILMFSWMGLFKVGRDVRRNFIDDCGHEHPLEWLWDKDRQYYYNRTITCQRPEGHDGWHSVSDGVSRDHQWSDLYCKYLMCAKCDEHHPRLRYDGTPYTSDIERCRKPPKHPGRHSRMIGHPPEEHVWGKAGCVHPKCEAEVRERSRD